MSSKYLPSSLFLLGWIITFPTCPTIGSSLAKPGCNDTCGNVPIPYPFGLTPGCALHKSYIIICNASKPYLSNLNLEVLDVSLVDQTVTVNAPLTYFCNSDQAQRNGTNSSRWISLDLAGTPFLYSQIQNKLMLFGCGNVVLTQEENKGLAGCTSICQFSSSYQAATSTSCNGVNCCQTTISVYLSKYSLNFRSLSFKRSGYCPSAFLVDQNWLPEQFSESLQFIPVVLVWTLSKVDVTVVDKCPYYNYSLYSDSGVYVEAYGCTDCPAGTYNLVYGAAINPYLQSKSRCIGRVRYFIILGAIVLIGGILSTFVLCLIAAIFTMCKIVKRKRNRRMKEKFFIRNGGVLLQQQLSADGVIERTSIFTKSELSKATNRFSEDRILGQGGQGTVYKGMLTDGKIVAIKKSMKVDESQIEPFINEVIVLSQVNHRNIVKLLGCCLETEVPLLVYEFIPNGTLSSLIHNQIDDSIPFTWNFRLGIAGEVAGALAYLHSAIAIPIYHRDVKSNNILLDEKYIAKVSDFGTSRSIEADKTHTTTLVIGTFGYLDPEYFQSSQFTEKSDVYSFGVVLVELLTRKKPISASESEEDSHLNLATRFLTLMDENRVDSILDRQLLHESMEEEIMAVAKLAQRCLDLNGKNRPTMKEVAIELENIKRAAKGSTVHSQLFKQGECESVLLADTETSWTAESDSTDAVPLVWRTV
ncbi:wall-associated receptor kinase-like 1 [Coffea arabica]|uniref:Wall-associated receptor kinase-like 1 n=1 Tax=Coffea arabica TaxID=13443 RepID=A0A6P6UCF0_COFAR|nr:wall-associated receptor kinase-like 1 [Coffea arabica]